MKPVQNVQNMKSVQYAQDSYVAHFGDYFFFKFEINEYYFRGWGWGWGVTVEVISEDFISEIV